MTGDATGKTMGDVVEEMRLQERERKRALLTAMGDTQRADGLRIATSVFRDIAKGRRAVTAAEIEDAAAILLAKADELDQGAEASAPEIAAIREIRGKRT